MKTLFSEIGEALAILNPGRESWVRRSLQAAAKNQPGAGGGPLAAYVRANRRTAGDPSQPGAAKTWWLP